MHSYFSTFMTGFGEVVSEELLKRLPNTKITLLTDGLVLYESPVAMDSIKKLAFLNNSFILVKKFEDITKESVNDIAKILINDQSLRYAFRSYFPKKQLSFRIRASVHNQFAPISKHTLRKLEESITVSNKNLVIDRSLPDLEVLISIRSEGFGLVGIQFTHRPNYEKTLQKGELYPELAYILSLISEPNKDQIFLDPFAGHGSIPKARLSFPHKQIVAGEIDKDLVKELTLMFNKRATIVRGDVFKANTYKDCSVDAIITDPPWGHHDQHINIDGFYIEMLKTFHRILRPNGVAVILTAQKVLMETLIASNAAKFSCQKRFSTLVSGKKAGVYTLMKL